VNVYLDASVLVALFTDDPFTPRADSFLRANALVLIVSDFAAAEFASVIARHVRTTDITPDNARIAFSTFDGMIARARALGASVAVM
jgi:predicted nucleic acid-binding protein